MRDNHWLILIKSKQIWLFILLLSILSCGLTIWKFIGWQQTAASIKEPEKRIQADRESLTTFTQVLGGTFVLLSLYLTARTIQVSHETRITDSFFQSIELLGDEDNVSKRIGGIYALERIAWDSEKDHWTIMEVLMAYLRQHATLDAYKEKSSLPSKTPDDIHAVIRTISRRKRTYMQGEDHAVDLQNLYLVGADFYEGRLQGIRFDGSNMDKASFKRANLDKARLRRTSLRGSDFTRASMKETELTGADLTDALLTNTQLEGADLSDVVGLTKSQIESAIVSHKTKLPSYLDKS